MGKIYRKNSQKKKKTKNQANKQKEGAFLRKWWDKSGLSLRFRLLYRLPDIAIALCLP